MTPDARLRSAIGAEPAIGRSSAAAALVLLVFCTHATLLATPGFYSHDEWQKFDEISALGFRAFAKAYGAVRVGPDFGYPVRPIGFLQQGIAALWMQSAPWLAHLVGILNHAVAVLLLAWVLHRAGMSRFAVSVAAVAFAASPLTTLATGWVGASFDQLYVIFLMLVAGIALRQAANGITPGGAACLLLFTGAAVLSKETAIVAPAGMLVLARVASAHAPQSFDGRRYAALCALVAAPVAAYLLYRAPAIANSLLGRAVERYAPSLASVPANAVRYFAFPFLPENGDMSGAVPVAWLAAAVLAHALLVLALGRQFGRRLAIAYLAGYFVFLVPVLPLPFAGAHYLYGGAPAISVALAALADRARTRSCRGPLTLAFAAIALLFVHAMKIESYVYDTGACQARFLDDLGAVLQDQRDRRAHGVEITADPGAPLGVARRAIFARRPYLDRGQPVVAFRDARGADGGDHEGAIRMRMTASCGLRAQP